MHGPDREWHTGGWEVRQLCGQPLDTLFFVHVAPSYWESRIHLRATLFEEAARAAFNWTGVFFVAQDKDPLVNDWTKLEAEVMGDVVVFHYNDTYFTTVYKFIRGMRWVTEYCPKVRNIVKIDHDVSVDPFELRRYLNENLPLKNSSIHCRVLKYNNVLRDGGDSHCVPEDQLPMDFYPHYCSGFSMMMTTDTMRKLYRASKFVKVYQIDDAYVSGHLALLANVGHVDIGRKVSLITWDVNTERMLNRIAIFAHERSVHGNSAGRRAQWELMIWRQMTETPVGGCEASLRSSPPRRNLLSGAAYLYQWPTPAHNRCPKAALFREPIPGDALSTIGA
ncbi:acetylgalactosaminyl-O-glycosyl-glycoprotein beta-1,3-N-acetylglucosaminyltransferase-like [Rhipicephalus sanguineus]|uniref:acetylgalactosaminyl-O-glycosyl-glycoprotein beta-1,3-N-acetylglucosaminyltransferase-like n=1 Tax=Rhipicephalus sanguineus TaxID=34632 RepID=UPI0020C4CCAB|nr:acetylgalactosaminyl-O-glycosyl-glycoprotein beta-1,3-N-acetylglucosaminyltransferase-like [Rhipicephalus sanguineus]